MSGSVGLLSLPSFIDRMGWAAWALGCYGGVSRPQVWIGTSSSQFRRTCIAPIHNCRAFIEIWPRFRDGATIHATYAASIRGFTPQCSAATGDTRGIGSGYHRYVSQAFVPLVVWAPRRHSAGRQALYQFLLLINGLFLGSLQGGAGGLMVWWSDVFH